MHGGSIHLNLIEQLSIKTVDGPATPPAMTLGCSTPHRAPQKSIAITLPAERNENCRVLRYLPGRLESFAIAATGWK